MAKTGELIDLNLDNVYNVSDDDLTNFEMELKNVKTGSGGI